MILYPTIPIDGTETPEFKIGDFKFVSMILPVLISCNITFKVSDAHDGDFVVLKDKDAATITITATTGNFAVGYIDELAAYQYIKIVASETQTTTARVFKVILKR